MQLLRLTLSLLIAALGWGHSISVSTSDGVVEDRTLRLTLRMPRYEVEQLPHAKLVASIQIEGAKLTASDCQPVETDLSCQLVYEFPAIPAERLAATVTLARVTVPNHVHIMKLTRNGIARQAIFDRTFEREQIDFHESAKAEIWWRAARMGFVQLGFQPILLILLLIVPRPLAYTIGAAIAFLLVLPDRFYAPPGFFELATAMALVYLALESLFFSQAGGKWIFCALIGAIEGTALAVLARPTGAGAVAFGTGNLLAAFSLSLLASHFSRNISERWIRILMWAFLALGGIWSLWVLVKRF